MGFVIYDLTFLGIIILGIVFFLYRGKKNITQEGPLILYKTKWGIKLIDYIGTKYKRTLKVLSYVSITSGYILMASILALLIQTLYLYLTTPISKVVRAPPIAPLIPYFPQIFDFLFPSKIGLSSIFPPFYATYFVISILIVATVHEFSHGIFMRRYGIKIKNTGFAFFKYMPLFLGAFVEQDEKDMKKKKNFEQMSVLSAGTFANVLTAAFFFGVLWLFFILAFIPSGVVFDNYPFSVVNISSIVMVNGIFLNNPSYEKILDSINKTGLNKIETNKKNYIITKNILELQKKNKDILILFDSAPAINSGIKPGKDVITKINGFKIKTYKELGIELKKYSPGQTITLTTYNPDNDKNIKYDITLDSNPNNPEKAFLGVGFKDTSKSKKGFSKIILNLFYFKEPNVYYNPKFDGWSEFIYNLLYWISLINILVALINMVPAWIFDGGLFFYLTISSITKSEKSAKKVINLMNKFLLLLIIVIMIKWVISFFI